MMSANTFPEKEAKNPLVHRDVPEFIGSRTETEKAHDRKTVVYDDSKQTVRVSELLENVTEAELKELFSEVGKVKYVKVSRTKNYKTQEWEGRGFAFVTFYDEKTAREALSYNNMLWQYQRIKVTPGKPLKRH
jgi:RNA recognition motif-containing protein